MPDLPDAPKSWFDLIDKIKPIVDSIAKAIIALAAVLGLLYGYLIHGKQEVNSAKIDSTAAKVDDVKAHAEQVESKVDKIDKKAADIKAAIPMK